jgi:nitric oxide dioxygenase
MNERQVQLVQHSFERASRVGAHLAATFYSELFAIDPSLRSMFKGDMIVQGEKLMNTLRFVVENLRQTDSLLPAARKLALRHLGYGVEAQHYAHVGTALMRTLKHELGAEFTSEAHQAWRAAYQMLADAMIEAAYPHLASRSA